MKKMFLLSFVLINLSLSAQSGYDMNFLKNVVANSFNTDIRNVTSIEVFTAQNIDYLYSQVSLRDGRTTIVASISGGGNNVSAGPGITITCKGVNCSECDLENFLPDPRKAVCVCKQAGDASESSYCDQTKSFKLEFPF